MSTRRRGRGEGSIVQRADGRWMARVDLGWCDGKRRSKAIYGRTRRAVATALRDALKEAEQGTLVADERQTVGEFLARWLSGRGAHARASADASSAMKPLMERHITPAARPRPAREADAAAPPGVAGDARNARRLGWPSALRARRAPDSPEHGDPLACGERQRGDDD